MNKRVIVLAVAWLIVSGCKIAGRHAVVSVPGPQGPAGPGCEAVDLQPGPFDSLGMDCTLSAERDNEGTQPAVSVGVDPRGDVQRMAIYFDVTQANLPAGSVVLAAVLSLYPNRAFCSQAAGVLHVYPITKTWTEKEITWNYAAPKSAWDRAGADYASTLPVGGVLVDGLKQTGA